MFQAVRGQGVADAMIAATAAVDDLVLVMEDRGPSRDATEHEIMVCTFAEFVSTLDDIDAPA